MRDNGSPQKTNIPIDTAIDMAATLLRRNQLIIITND